MTWCGVLVLGSFLLPVLAHSNEVYQLRGEGDYRFATLHWQSPAQLALAGLSGFQINYCELQAWGPNRCRSKYMDATSGEPPGGESQSRLYSMVVSGLRMATNYSFEVTPRQSRRTRLYIHDYQRGLHDPSANTIVVPTKGFSAKASLCLPDVSEVEVATGPYFSGRIAVETAADTQHCLVDGNGSSPKDLYTLRIDHKLCGSKVNRTAVETFILVQENLPILTHSTRRFLVLCTFQPETLTVRAGLNLPATSRGVSSPAAVDEVMDNNVQASALQVAEEAGRGRSHAEQASEAQMVVLAVVVAAGLVAIGLTVWWFIPIKSKSRSSRQSILSDDNTYTSNSTVYENYENSIRDLDLDFETIQDICEDCEENALREGVCNEILQESCASLALEPMHTVTIECTTHSEA